MEFLAESVTVRQQFAFPRSGIKEEEETENAENDGKVAKQEPSTSDSVSPSSISTSQDVRLPRKRCRQHAVYGCAKCSGIPGVLVDRQSERDEADGDPADISSTTPDLSDLSDSPSGSRRRKSRPFRVMRACAAPAVPCQPSYDSCLPPPPPPFPRETVKRQQCHPAFQCKKQRLCTSWEQPDTATPTLHHPQIEEPDSSTHPAIKPEPTSFLSSTVPESHVYYHHPPHSQHHPHYSYNMLSSTYAQSQQYFPPYSQHPQPHVQFQSLQYHQPQISFSSSTISEPQESVVYSKLEPVCPDSGAGDEESNHIAETELATYKTKMDDEPCGVCGDAAAGFHCGAYVCEACKKFYIRSTKADNANRYQCSKSGQCEISKDTRTHCQYCRYNKCQVLGMYPPGSRSTEISNISVIPCRVCGANSSGFHFGAITCEGCKGFFRRTVNERESNRYQCSKGGACDITVTTRNNCKSCRYKKCLFVGMSKGGSRIGRQPNAIKHMCAKEIEAIQSLNPYSSALPMRAKPLPRSCQQQEMMVPESREDVAQREFIRYFKNKVVNASNHLFAMINVNNTNADFPPCSSRLTNDMRMEAVWDVMMEFFQKHADYVFQFMKEIPNFQDLYKKLLPSSRFFVQESMYPIMLIMLGQCYDLNTGSYNYFSFLPCDRDVIMKSFPSFEKICNHLMKSGRHIKSIGFDTTEVALLCAIEVTRNGLGDEDRQCLISGLHDLCVQALDLHMRDKGEDRISLEVITNLQEMLTSMNREHHDVISALKLTHPNLKFPDLYIGMFLEEPAVEASHNQG